MNKDQFLQQYLTACRWAMQRQTLQSLCGIVERHVAGEKLSDEQLQRIAAGKPGKEADQRKYELTADGTATLHITGVIAKYSSMVNDVSQPQGTSIEFLARQLDMAMDDKRVRSIFLRIESPGGSMPGLPDFADRLYQASFEKPVVAFADDLADSAAYWLGSQANVFYANQSAMVGCIGVYMVIPDLSKRAEMYGAKYNIVASGPNKGAGYPGSEVTDSQLDVFQEEINADHEMFLAAVIRGRIAAGLDEETLRRLADGREYPAAAAAEYKLVDEIMTLDEALNKQPPTVRQTGTFAAAASAETIKSERKEKTMEDKTQTQTQTATAAGKADAQPTAESERARIMAIQSALAGEEFREVSAKAVAEGFDLQKAKAEAFEVARKKHAEETRAAAEKLALLQTRLDAIAASGHAEELIPQKATDSGHPLRKTDSAAGSAEAFETAITNLQKDGKTTYAEAIRKAARQYPDDHKAWLQDKQKK